MPFDQKTRGLLQRTVSACRQILDDEFTKLLQEVHGIQPSGTVAPLDTLRHLTNEQREVSRLLRERLSHLDGGSTTTAGSLTKVKPESVAREIREQAFTTLNRLAALRMCEERGFVQECVRRGTASDGFQLFLQSAGASLGDSYSAYAVYLGTLFDELALDLGVLFDRFSAAGLLFPRRQALELVLGELNGTGEAIAGEEITPEAFNALWAEDETIGWIYQYYNDPAERKKMRDESTAPRNSRELAVRNQFFTPRYVVEFLTDNTLGRIWYEMRRGATKLTEQCRYLVRRPNEIFLGDPKEAYEWLFGKPEGGQYAFIDDAVLAAYQGDLSKIDDDSGPKSRLIALAIPPNQFEKISGEAYQSMEESRLGRLSHAIVRGEPNPDTDNLLMVWAALSDSTLDDGGGAYSREPWRKLWSHFLTLARRSLPKEEVLLKQPIFIPHRPLKDPREVRLLDPACGSMHFGLYAFDLYTAIYEEAWDLAHRPNDSAKRSDGFARFIEFTGTFADETAFLRDVPRLIIEHNLHGVDIDPRAAQIAGLSLWLRAQRTWFEQEKVGQREDAAVSPRPRIRRSSIVCAEPMPGEKNLLREFVEQQFPTSEQPVFTFLLEKIFDLMTLAGEAGSLLRIEEQISTAVADAMRLWREGPVLALDFGAKTTRSELRLDLSGITDEQFWERAEQRIYEALAAYAKQVENAGGFRRRLFADDAAQGFAFIDLCRKRYEVVVMNPPFGDPTATTGSYLEEHYPESNRDIYSMFIICGMSSLICGGGLGAITSRAGFFLASMEQWRTSQFLEKGSLSALVDLGYGVLDAKVETAAYCNVRSTPPRGGEARSTVPFINLLAELNKDEALTNAIDGIRHGKNEDAVHLVSPQRFRRLPTTPFAYATPDQIFHLYSTCEVFESDERHIRAGVQTSDDFRFLRCWWEVPPEELLNPRGMPAWDSATENFQQACRAKSNAHRWYVFAKGGEYSPFFADIPLVINWSRDGEEVKAYAETTPGTKHWSRNIRSTEFFFRSGLTYLARTSIRLCATPLPAGSIISNEAGPGVFVARWAERWSLGRFNSMALERLTTITQVRGMEGDDQTKKYVVGALQKLPWPERHPNESDAAINDALHKVQLLRSAEELSRFFTNHSAGASDTLEGAANAIWNVERCVASAYGLDPIECARETISANSEEGAVEGIRKGLLIGASNSDPKSISSRSVAYAAGCAFGRWDARYAVGERQVPELPDPFAPLPVCPPGMLQGDDGLPLSAEAGRRMRTEGRYPLDVAWDGILVDDAEHPLDLERRVHAALAAISDRRADALEHEARALLGVSTLREWFRRPTGFFADHLKRYSKSRRQAPIYWPLSTASGSYTLWLYYHRLTADTLYKCLQQFVGPKLAETEKQLGALRTLSAGGPTGTKVRRQLEQLETLRNELLEIRAEFEYWAPKWKPNLNDGVLITACPLWKLFRLPKWRKDLETCWEELERGDYDWAHLAYSLWPDRVREKCRSDRSLAIAHGLEELCPVTQPEKKVSRGKRKPAHAKETETPA